MKKIIFIFILGIFISNKSFAQHEVKTNILGYFVSSYSLSYEFVFKEKKGINVAFWHQNIRFKFSYPVTFLNYNYTSKGALMEYRFYFQKKAHPANGLWLAPYVKCEKQIHRDIGFFKTINNIFNNADGISRIDIKDIGVGIAGGIKWIFKDKFIFGLYSGIGGHPYAKISLVDDNGKALGYENYEELKQKAQHRFGFNMGYRFGQ